MGCLWKQELKRAFHLQGFFIGVFLIAGGFALTMFRDYGVVDGITALQETMGNVEFAVFGVVGAAIPYSAAFVSEWKSRNFLYQIGRSGINEYCIFKLSACFFTGGSVSLVGRFLLLAGVLMQKPLISETAAYIGEGNSVYYTLNLLAQGHWIGCILGMFWAVFLYGGVWAVFGMMFSVWIPEKLSSWILPYLSMLFSVVILHNLPQWININYMAAGGIIKGIPEPVHAVALSILWCILPSILFYKGICFRIERA